MFQPTTVLMVLFIYLAVLFIIAYYGDKRAFSGHSLLNNPYIYTFSLAIYCTAWTFYGSVGRASVSGIDFLAIYIGPTLFAPLWWLVVRKTIRIAKIHHITSVADFIGSRYGKSTLLAGLVTLIALIGTMPYISLQLKAISMSLEIIGNSSESSPQPWHHSALYIALILAAFTIVFGTRHIDTTEKHEGMVLAIAFESLVKLFAFLAVGIFVTFFVFEGFDDLFTQAATVPHLQQLMTTEYLNQNGYASWVGLNFLAAMAFTLLPRQFQVTVVENVNEDHVKTAVWLFPLYFLLINLFVIPIAFGGSLFFPTDVKPDTYVLMFPLSQQAELLSLLVLIGGASAAMSMIVVETIVLATMVCNDLVMPILLRLKWLRLAERQDLTRLLLFIRRSAIILILTFGWLYLYSAAESQQLVSIGLVSFVAITQLAPAFFLGLYWKGASYKGILVGLTLGFSVWIYTLLLPNLAITGWLSSHFLEVGPWGLHWLNPHALFGLSDFAPITHALFWSLLVNLGCSIGISLFAKQRALEQIQASAFVDVFKQHSQSDHAYYWEGQVDIKALHSLLIRFLGEAKAQYALEHYSKNMNIEQKIADFSLVEFAERLLAGAIGSASAHVVISTVVRGKTIGIEGIMRILDESSQVKAYSQELEKKSQALELENMRLATELNVARRLQEMLLPKVSELEHIPGLEIAGFMEPATEVGGDYYDVLQYDGKVKISIGDITGHGLESGILALMTQTAVRTLLENRETDPVCFFSTLNRTLYANIQRMGLDKSLTLVTLDYDQGKVILSGQHEEVIVVRQGGKIQRIQTDELGFPLGLEEEIKDFISQAQIHLQPGEGIVLYTDGITEAQNSSRELYRVERLCRVISRHWHETALEMRRIVIEDVKQFTGQKTPDDDITLVIVKRV